MRAVRDLPSGTVTFLFTDIEGSTKRLHDLGPARYADALADHRRLLRETFARHGGVEVDTQGDAFFVAFPTAPGALEAAREAQAQLAIPVRMGIHTGTPLLTSEGYVGSDVHKAARIAAVGHGQQIVVSAATAALLPGDDLLDLGQHRLKDLDRPTRLYQLGERQFPPLRSLHQTNLPVPATPFLGREAELADVLALLAQDEVRLLTLAGAGGSGKTRLALQAAGEAADEYPQGVWWVPLAPVADADEVMSVAGRALGGGGPLAEVVGERRLLLLLDNFEHVVDAAGQVAALLTACPRLDVLVTSRERLRVQGEQVYPVPVLNRRDAQELFIARARAVQPGFAANGQVDELCARLDDLPLALELAAARTSLLTTEQLLERLGSRLDLLRGGRDSEVRQRTLRATIEWSYELLGSEEQQLLAALSIFRGGWTLEAAEHVCNADLELLESLVDKSLVRRWESGRFGMLETLREFASERLRESGREQALGRAHAEFFLALADSANLSSERTDRGQHHELVVPEQDNLRAALDWAAESGEIELGLGLVVALESFWATQAPQEGMRRVEALLEQATEIPDVLRARAIRVLGGVTFLLGEFDRGTELYRQSLELFRLLGDERAVAHLRSRLAISAFHSGDLAGARALSDESRAANRRLGSSSGEAMALGVLADLTWAEGRRDEAIGLVERAADAAAEVGFTWWQMNQLYRACEWSLELGRIAETEAYGREALRIAGEIRERQLSVYLLAILAATAAMQGRVEEAGVLWGALETEEARGPVGQWEQERDVYASRVLAHGGPEFEAGQARGRALSLDAAVEQALADA